MHFEAGSRHRPLASTSSIRAAAGLALSLAVPFAPIPGCTSTIVDDNEQTAALPLPQPGRPVGAACAFDDQCATRRCNADVAAGTCGECVTIKALGQGCTGLHEGCSTSAICQDGVCRSLRKNAGEPCALGGHGGDLHECDDELWCADVSGSGGVCVPLRPLGAFCGGDFDRCQVGAECNSNNVCAAYDPGACHWGACAPGSYCGADLRCHVGTLPQNAPCGDDGPADNECGPYLACVHVESRDGDSTEASCLPLPGKGEPCLGAYNECAEGLFCLVSQVTDSIRFCETLRVEGEACDITSYYTVDCAAGLECRGQVCRVACQ
jgi:hypothetical protein